MRPSTAIVLKNLGRRMLSLLDLDDCTVHSRHVDQVRYKSAGQCSAHSSLSSDNDSSILDTTLNDTENENREEERTEAIQPRRSERLKDKSRVNYKAMVKTNRGGCGDCDCD